MSTDQHARPLTMDAFLRYGDRAASTRQRLLQYQPALADKGIAVETHALLSNDYVASIGSTSKPGRLAIGREYARRLSQMRSARTADAIWAHFELLPYVPAVVEQALLPHGVPLMLDYDDAWFHTYDQHPSRAVRRVLGTKIERLMSRATLVACGNPYIRDYADACGARTILLPTVVDTDVYRPAERAHEGRPVIGWMGSPTTSTHLRPILPVLRRIVDDGLADVRIVGSTLGAEVGRWAELRDWTAAGEVSDLQGFDIGIMPLEDTIFARGKCGYKLIQYMACGTAAVGSPVGVNASIVREGETGYLARTPDEWDGALRGLLSNVDRRRAMGEAGRADAVALWSLAAHAPRFAKAVQSIAQP